MYESFLDRFNAVGIDYTVIPYSREVGGVTRGGEKEEK